MGDARQTYGEAEGEGQVRGARGKPRHNRLCKDAINTKNTEKARRLLAVLGQAEPPYHRLADNRAWEALLQ